MVLGPVKRLLILMSAFTETQRSEFAVIAAAQIQLGSKSCEYPDIRTTAQKVEAFFVAGCLEAVARVDVSFANQSEHVVLQLTLKNGKVIFMCFPSANKQRDMHLLVWIIHRTTEHVLRGSGGAEDSMSARRDYALSLAIAMDTEPSYQQCLQALQECKAVVWTREKIIRLDEKPVFPSQVKRTLESVGVHMCSEEGHMQLELRLLGMQPSVYVLGAKDGHQNYWSSLPNEIVSATFHLEYELHVRSQVKEACILYYE